LQLTTAGVLLESIESFQTISEDTYDRSLDCVGFPYFIGEPKATDLRLSWEELPDDTSIVTTDTGILTLEVSNETTEARAFTVRYAIAIGPHTVELEEATDTLAARDSTTFELDLSDLIPGGIDPENVNSMFFFRPSSVPLIASAEIIDGGESIEYAFAPVLYGHAHDEDTLKIYRQGAMKSTYYCRPKHGGKCHENHSSGGSRWCCWIRVPRASCCRGVSRRERVRAVPHLHGGYADR
jgi:hypothetical protein